MNLRLVVIARRILISSLSGIRGAPPSFVMNLRQALRPSPSSYGLATFSDLHWEGQGRPPPAPFPSSLGRVYQAPRSGLSLGLDTNKKEI